MRLPDASRCTLVRVSLACTGIGLLAFAASDLLWARASYLTLDAAREATADANWRSSVVPVLPGESIFDVLGIAGIVLLLVLMLARALPAEARRPVGLSLTIMALGFIVSFARPFVDRTHDHEGAWGALQVGIMTSALVVLVWPVLPARVVGIAGAGILTLRQPLIWRASDEYVRATGDAAAAYGAEFARLAAFTVGATGALLLAAALFLASTRFPPRLPAEVNAQGEGMSRGTLPSASEGDNTRGVL